MAFPRSVLSYLFRTQPQLSEADTGKSGRLLMADGVCSMSMMTLQGGPFLPAFALALGATNYDIGLIATIAFFSQLMQLPGLLLMRAIPVRRALVAVAATVARSLWVLIILLPLLFPDRGVAFLIQWLFVSAFVGALAGPAWNSLLRDIVPESAMGKIFARRLMLGNLFVIAVTLGGGFFVEGWKGASPDTSLYAYPVLFALGLLFGLAGVVAVVRLPEPARETGEGSAESVFATLWSPVKDGNFRRLVTYIALWTFAINLAAPFFIIYMLQRIGLPLSTVTMLFVLSQVTNVLFLRIWGRLADRFSNKSVLAVSGPLFLAAILLWTFTTMPERYVLTMPLLVAIHILTGMSLAGVSLATVNIALKLSPKGQAHSFMAVYGVAGAAAGGVAPMLAGMFADFFASRELAVSVSWAAPGKQYAVHALNFRALDFLFVLAFIVGLFAMRLLRRVVEKGEAEETVVRDELRNEVVGGLRTISAVPGVRHLVTIPVSAAYGAIHEAASKASSPFRKQPEGENKGHVDY
jgi:MFS family permease